MKTDPFLKSIKYEYHGPEGTGDAGAVERVSWSDGFRMIDLFSGIGGIRLGFESVGGRVVFSSEYGSQC